MDIFIKVLIGVGVVALLVGGFYLYAVCTALKNFH